MVFVFVLINLSVLGVTYAQSFSDHYLWGSVQSESPSPFLQYDPVLYNKLVTQDLDIL